MEVKQPIHKQTEPGKEKGHGFALIIGACITLLLLGSLEYVWRGQGHAPASIDNQEIWALNRRQASDSDPATIVFAGSSRIQTAIDPKVFVEESGLKQPIVLGLGWASPLPVLRDLADDPEFRGTVICSVLPVAVYSDHDLFHRKARRNIEFTRGLRPVDHLEFRLKDTYHHFVAISVYNVWRVILPEIVLDLRSIPLPGSMDSARYHRFDSKKIRDKSHMQAGQLDNFRKYALAPGPEALKKIAFEYRSVREKLKRKGSQMILVRPPSSDPLLELERSTFPRTQYWDRLVEIVNVPAIHFEDYPSLQGYRMPDFSHISGAERPAFTRAFVSILLPVLSKPAAPEDT